MNKKFGFKGNVVRKDAFTLAEGTPRIDALPFVARCAFTNCRSALPRRQRKIAFTLAEVLITLAVIGVVAAMTIPTLVANINDKVTENQNKVFQAKLIKALNLTKTAGLLNNTYTSTEDFLRRGLATHYKMSSICGKDDLRSCVPYDKIYFGENNESVNVADLKTPASIKITDAGFEDTAAFVTADGIPVIVSYKKDCLIDTEMLDKGISSCLAGIYDLNGSKLPNKYGVVMDGDKISSYTNDIHSFNGAGVGSSNPKINGVEIVVKAFNPEDIYNAVGAPTFTVDPYGFGDYAGGSTAPDYWTAAQKWCNKNNAKLPTIEQMTKIAQILYNDPSITADFSQQNVSSRGGLNWDANKTAVFDALGVDAGSSSFYLWSAENSGYHGAFAAGFTAKHVQFYDDSRVNTGYHAFCVSK